MAMPLDQFVRQLEDSGILAGEILQEFIPPNGSSQDTQELAQELIRRQKLTAYQVEETLNGQADSLVLGNYILLEKIGAGGMGEVFKARHRRMDRLVAVKVVSPARIGDESTIARFEREVKAAAKISHPNIVTAFDADQARGVHFLVMELVEGSDLSTLIKKEGPLSVRRAVNYILQAAKGLEAAHLTGIIHRDVKPANLLLDKSGTVKILDLGLARFGGDGETSLPTDLTSTGTIMGTADYMAPEQAIDTRTADARADIYSLGCSLYFLLNGKVMYGGDTAMKKVIAHREHPAPPLLASGTDAFGPLESLYQKMVAKRLEDRYQTMAQVVAALEQVVKSLSLSPTPESLAKTHLDLGSSIPAETRKDRRVSPSDPTAIEPRTKISRGRSHWIFMALGGTFFGLLAAAAIMILVKTKDGTLVVEVDQPGATVQVDAQEKVHVVQKDGKPLVALSVDPGKHRLLVEKEGFQVFGRDFEIGSGGKTEITARLEPLGREPADAPAPKAPATTGEKLLGYQMPGFDQWVKVVVALSAKEQVQVVAEKLQELNPGFDGKVVPTIGEGVVISMEVPADHVTDLSPLRALRNLSYLECYGSYPRQGKLADLSPLRGLALRGFWCSNTQIADLSPLEGMPIKKLVCQFTQVADLSPVSGMPLRHLRCTGTRVADLTPLKGLQLEEAQFEYTPITNLWALKGMPLTSLHCSGTAVSDLTPLKGMQLGFLDCSATEVRDLSLLKEMPLKHIVCSFNPARDAEVLKSIKTLEIINGKPVAEFWKEVEAK